MIKCLLETNFRDFYDAMFDVLYQYGDEMREPHLTFRRFDTEGPNRRDALAYLERQGVPVVEHGPVAMYGGWLSPDERGYRLHATRKVVVYTDEQSHRGEGKELLALADALVLHPDAHCSLYQEPPEGGPSESIRCLVVGERGFRLTYTSSDDWRSNCGEVEVVVTGGWPLTAPLRRIAQDYPLFAIDYVPRQRHAVEATTMPRYVAVDFNTAPRMDGTGLKDHISMTQVFTLIRASLVGQLDRAVRIAQMKGDQERVELG